MAKSTLATRLARVIRRAYVDSGMLRRGDPLPSIRELQALYGGSVTTLAHALGQLEAQGIIEKRQGRGCFLKQDALDTPRSGPVRTLGVVIPQPVRHELMARLYDGIASGAERAGMRLMMATRPPGAAPDGMRVERQGVAQMVDAGCDAIVVAPAPRFHAELDDDYLAREFREVPIVLVDLALPEHARSHVIFDNRAAGRDMTHLLLDAGHEHVAFTHYRRDGREVVWRSIADRQQGYLGALRERGLAPRPEDYWLIDQRESWLDEYGNPRHHVLDFLQERLNQPNHATAVVTCSDELAIAFIQGAHALGIRVPDDLDVTGFDNMSQGQVIRPSFPTTNPDFTLAGEKAVDLAVLTMNGELAQPASYILPLPVIARRSTREGREAALAQNDTARAATSGDDNGKGETL